MWLSADIMVVQAKMCCTTGSTTAGRTTTCSASLQLHDGFTGRRSPAQPACNCTVVLPVVYRANSAGSAQNGAWPCADNKRQSMLHVTYHFPFYSSNMVPTYMNMNPMEEKILYFMLPSVRCLEGVDWCCCMVLAAVPRCCQVDVHQACWSALGAGPG